ncbi:hypothetical protein, partial [Nocardiopsis sp. MG754419]|uniref:hypothetical protein n=1 Tax=Nocardiopsis sp. MG754419 TaxID=2259865 RepID=UPI001BA5F3CC
MSAPLVGTSLRGGVRSGVFGEPEGVLEGREDGLWEADSSGLSVAVGVSLGEEVSGGGEVGVG